MLSEPHSSSYSGLVSVLIRELERATIYGMFMKLSLVRIILLLLLFNSIKIPPNEVPVIHYPNLFVDGMAIPFFIFVKYDVDEIIEHERCHIKQMNEYGPINMLIVNAYYKLKYGYHNNPFEVQAYNNCKTPD